MPPLAVRAPSRVASQDRMSGGERNPWMQPSQLLLQRYYALLHGANGRHSIGDELDLFGSKGLGDVIGRSPPHGFDGGVNGCISRDDDDLDPWTRAENGRNQVESVLRAQPQIHKCKIEDLSIRLQLGVLSIAYGDHAMTARLKADRKRLAYVGLVIHDEDVEGWSTALTFHRHLP